MSWQAVQAVMDHSRAKGSERMVLMVIATHAEKDGLTAFVSVERLCAEANMSERNMQYTLAKLRALGELRSSPGIGRGHANNYSLQLQEKVQPAAPIKPAERVQSVAQKVQSTVKRVQPIAPQPVEPEIQPEKTKKVGAHAPPPDPRSKHPAIQAVKAIMSRYPEKVLWDDLIETLSEKPDINKLSACRKAWVKAGFNPNSTAWALEWYANGIPERIQASGANNGNRFKPDRSETNVSRWRAIAADPDFGFAEDPTGSPPGVDEPHQRGDGFPDAPRAVA